MHERDASAVCKNMQECLTETIVSETGRTEIDIYAVSDQAQTAVH